jgi:DNA-binding transcriptional ArsR family regulator
MRQAREIIRLKLSASVPTREIARRLGLAPSTVRETLKRLDGCGLTWPLPEGMSDGDLEAALYANRRSKRGHRRHAEPDWPGVHRELKRKHVTLVIVWDEYIAANPAAIRVMLRPHLCGASQRMVWFPWLDPQHNFERRCDYRAFRNVISDGSFCGGGLLCRLEISTRASAFAFISMSTSA